MQSELFNSDFSDDDKGKGTIITGLGGIINDDHDAIDLSEVSDEDDSHILVTEDEIIRIGNETIVFISSNKNTTIKLPYLKGTKFIKTKKGKLYSTRKITIKAMREQFNHNIFPAKKNTINGNSGIYMLKGGNTVTFYQLDKSWYADK